MKKLAVILALLFSLPGCHRSREEEAKRELIRQQTVVVETELQGIERNHAAMSRQLAALQSSLNDLNSELARGNARLVATGGANKYLLELSTVGFGPSAGRWVLENQVWPANVLLLFALAVVLIWVLYRVRLSTAESAAMAEVDRVLSNLNSPPPAPPVRPAAAPVTPVLQAPAPAAKAHVAPAPQAPPAPTVIPDPSPAKPKSPAPVAPAPTVEAARPVAPSARAAKAAPTAKAGAAAPDPAEKPADKQAEKPAAKPAEKAEASKRAVSRRDVRRKTTRPQAKKCKVEGCPNKHRSKGYCNKHYQQWRRSGNPEGEKEE